MSFRYNVNYFSTVQDLPSHVPRLSINMLWSVFLTESHSGPWQEVPLSKSCKTQVENDAIDKKITFPMILLLNGSLK